MNISAVTSLIQASANTCVNKKLSFKCGLKTDTFEKNTPDSVSCDNDAIKWFKETDFINKHLAEVLANSDNIIGEGFSHIVFQIPGNEDYILRTRKTHIPHGEIKNAEIKDVEDKNLKINIGQSVAEITFDFPDSSVPSRIEVLKRQKGEPIGVKPPSAIYIEDTDKLRENELPYGDISRKEAYERTIHKTAQLPLEAYEKLIDDLRVAGALGYKFDYYNSNNILVDSDAQSLNLIDMDAAGIEVDYGSVLYALTNIQYYNTFTGQYEQPVMSMERKMNIIDDTITIIDKYVQAMKNKGVKFSRENSSMYFFQLLESIPCKMYCQCFDYREMWAKFEQMGVA